MTNDFLKHVGVLGMHWGHRNSSGSEEHQAVRSLRKKKIQDMTNKELQQVITRKNLVKQYKDLNPSAMDAGKKAVAKLLVDYGTKTAAAVVSAVAVKHGADLAAMILGKKPEGVK